MTRMTSTIHSQHNHKGMAPACENGGVARTGKVSHHDFNPEYSIALPYTGPAVNYPLPKAELAVPYNGLVVGGTLPKAEVYVPDVVKPQAKQKGVAPVDNKNGRRLSDSLISTMHASSPSPGASSSASPLSDVVSGNGVVRVSALPRRSSPSEIEELNPGLSLPAQFFRRSPSFEADSSGFQYSEELSAAESGELTPGGAGASPAVVNGELGPSPSSRNGRESQQRRKGQCYRCFRGNRLTEKEVCFVCGAKYCVNCVLKAMGSMSEGRKCEGCVGCPIRESRRPYLGKPSRLLKRLLDPREIQLCMRSERECLGNQLQPEQICVNGRPLVAEEMAILATCVKLKPGKFWYDDISGLWGKEGEGPEKVITPSLKIGGRLQQNASGGSTQVFINSRQVTKSELKFLKISGVQCTPPTYLNLNPDGGYGEEGQKELKGNLWNRTTTKLLHPFFSFPTPRSIFPEPNLGSTSARLPSTYVEVTPAQNVLLFGHDGSGRCTIFKQVKIIENGQFTSEEVRRYTSMILDKVYQFLYVLLEARERFEEEDVPSTSQNVKVSAAGIDSGRRTAYTLDERLKNAADRFLDGMAKGGLERSTLLNAQFSLGKIWNDPSVKATFKRKRELHLLPDVDDDLVSRVLQSSEYVASEQDILLAEGLEQGTGLAEIDFTLEDKDSDSSEHESDRCRYHLISIGGLASNEFRKWLGMFEDVQVLIFCVAISDYDQWWTDSSGAMHNKLIVSRDLFVRIVNYPCFQDTPLVLLLNKYDKFEEKVGSGVQLTTCEWFSDYTPVSSSHSSKVQQAYMYVVHKFKRLLEGRRLYTLQLNAQDRNMVAGALDYVQQVLKCEDDKKAGLWMSPQGESIYDDTTSFTVQNHRFHGKR